MSENKQNKADTKAAEEISKRVKAIEIAKEGTKAAKKDLDAARKVYGDALIRFNNVNAEDANSAKAAKKDLDAAQKEVEKLELELLKSKDNEEVIRVKNSQQDSYIPDKKERKIFHVRLDKTAYDPKTGKKISKDFIQKFTIAEWNMFVKSNSGLGYETEIVWNPIMYNL